MKDEKNASEFSINSILRYIMNEESFISGKNLNYYIKDYLPQKNIEQIKDFIPKIFFNIRSGWNYENLNSLYSFISEYIINELEIPQEKSQILKEEILKILNIKNLNIEEFFSLFNTTKDNPNKNDFYE